MDIPVEKRKNESSGQSRESTSGCSHRIVSGGKDRPAEGIEALLRDRRLGKRGCISHKETGEDI